MNKFYITCGDHQYMCSASTQLQACLFMFYRYFSLDNNAESIGGVFRVSERGYDEHDDDEHDDDVLLSTGEIAQLALLNNEYKADKEEQECEE